MFVRTSLGLICWLTCLIPMPSEAAVVSFEDVGASLLAGGFTMVAPARTRSAGTAEPSISITRSQILVEASLDGADGPTPTSKTIRIPALRTSMPSSHHRAQRLDSVREIPVPTVWPSPGQKRTITAVSFRLQRLQWSAQLTLQTRPIRSWHCAMAMTAEPISPGNSKTVTFSACGLLASTASTGLVWKRDRLKWIWPTTVVQEQLTT